MATTATVGSRCVNYPILIQEGSYRKFAACGLCRRLKRTLVSIVCLIGGQVLVPAAAVIPTPRVYLNVAAVKKLVVEFLAFSRPPGSEKSSAWRNITTLKSCGVDPAFYFEEIRVFLAGTACIY
jgi:hypothetical protein